MSQPPPPGAPGFVPTYRMILAGLGVAPDEIGDGAPLTVDGRTLATIIAVVAASLPLDETFYRAQVPDLDAQVAAGICRDARDHFVRIGFAAGLPPHRLAFDPAHYEATNPGLSGLRRQGGPMALVAHFLQLGQHEARSAHAATDAAALTWRLATARAAESFAHRTIDGALVQAFRHPLLGPTGVGFRGGPALGDPADARMRHRRSGNPVDTIPNDGAPVGALGGTYVYAGFYCGPFGHAMAETLHRIVPARALFDCRRLLFVGHQADGPPAGFEALPPPIQAALRFLDVRPEEVTVLHDDRVVERLHVVEQGADLGGEANPAYLALLNDVTPARLQALDDGTPRPSRLYVSRSELRHGGIVLGEAYLQSLLAAEGWHVLHPQEHDLVTQMQFYRHADIVMFAEGSAAHGVELFGARALSCCVLWPRRTTSRHVFEPLLRPRCRRYEVLPGARVLGGIAIDPSTGTAADQLGVSLADTEGFVSALRALNFASLAGFSPRAYAAAARQDFETHLAWLQQTGFYAIDTAAVPTLRAALGG